MSNYKINGNVLTGIADGIRTAGDSNENTRYSPSEMVTEVAHLAENYNDALNVIEQDNNIFDDISEAIQGKTGQQEPYAKDELAQAVEDLDIYQIPVDSLSEVPLLVTGIDASGFYLSSSTSDHTDVLFGVDENNNLYVTERSEA